MDCAEYGGCERRISGDSRWKKSGRRGIFRLCRRCSEWLRDME